jgi:pyridoxal phosphate enzyme (YggS family)
VTLGFTEAGAVADNVARVQDAIAEAAHRAGRHSSEITLVGVSKTRPATAIAAAVQAGIRHIGENRVQEAAEKFSEVRELLPEMPVCHMIGHLQTNKAATAVQLFDRIDSVDSVRLAQALSRRVASDRVLPVLVEVYVGDDAARPGVRPRELEEVVGQLIEVPRIRVEGLMTVAPLGQPPRPAFAQLREMGIRLASLYPRVHFGVLSMGMSEDYQIAIEEGSTEVRVGTALFGSRQRK